MSCTQDISKIHHLTYHRYFICNYSSYIRIVKLFLRLRDIAVNPFTATTVLSSLTPSGVPRINSTIIQHNEEYQTGYTLLYLLSHTQVTLVSFTLFCKAQSRMQPAYNAIFNIFQYSGLNSFNYCLRKCQTNIASVETSHWPKVDSVKPFINQPSTRSVYARYFSSSRNRQYL